MRSSSFILPGIFGKQVSFADKLKLLKLSNQLKKKSLDAIFTNDETSTIDYLHHQGFSDDVLQTFFYPFFTGIYLEDELRSSSKKFEFVYKMFSEGLATIPEKGIQAIPNQLYAQLKETAFHFNEPVEKVENQTLTLKNGKSETYDYVIITTDAGQLISNLPDEQTDWRSVVNLYFSVKNKVIDKKLIGLINRKENALINNLHYCQPIDGNTHLLSVSIIKSFNLTDKELIAQRKERIEKYSRNRSKRIGKKIPYQKGFTGNATDQLCIAKNRNPTQRTYFYGR